MDAPSRSPSKPAGAAVALGAFALYAATCARGPVFGDGLEFAAAAGARGIPHPTGYPLLTMVLAAFGGGSYFVATLVCAAFAAAGAWLVFVLAARMLASAAPAAFIALLWAAGVSTWRSATSVEVYGLNACLVLAVLALLLPAGGGAPTARRAALACFLQGLALCNHLSAIAFAPFVALQVGRAAIASKSTAARLRVAATFVACGIAGLLPWLWLPLRARANPAINWGDPETLESFLWIVRGGDYGQTQFLMEAPGRRFSFGGWLSFAAMRLGLLLRSAGAEILGGAAGDDSGFRVAVQALFGAILLSLVVAGIVSMLRRHRLVTASLLVGAAFQLFVILTYNIRDIGDYFLGLWATLLPFAVAGAALAGDRLRDKIASAPRVPLFAATAVVACALLANLGAAGRSNDRVARVWIDRTLEALPRDAVVLTQADYDSYGLWYAQIVEGRRRDVLVVAANFLRYGWYATMLPEPGTDPLGRVATASQRPLPRSAEEHVRMLDAAAIAPNVGRVPVFITDVDRTVLQLLAAKYRVELAALLLEGLADSEIQDAAERLPALPPPALYRLSPLATPEPPTP